VTFDRRAIQRRIAGLGIARVDERAAGKQLLDCIPIAFPGGFFQRGRAAAVAGVDVDTTIQQQQHQIGVTAVGGQVQGCSARIVGGRNVRATRH